jgi:hypothetical protein
MAFLVVLWILFPLIPLDCSGATSGLMPLLSPRNLQMHLLDLLRVYNAGADGF